MNFSFQCVASLSTFYWRSNEESVEGDRPQKAPVLESRETVYASNSRADPVQGMSLRESFVTKILSFFIQPNAANKSDSSVSIKPITIILLIAMALLTTTGYLEQFYLNNNLLTNTKNQSRQDSRRHSHYKDNNDEDDVEEKKRELNLRKNCYASNGNSSKETGKFKRIICNKILLDFNKEMSSLPVKTNALKETQITSICAATLPQQQQHVTTTLETSVSLTNTSTATTRTLTVTSSTSSSSTSCCSCHNFSSTETVVKSLKSR